MFDKNTTRIREFWRTVTPAETISKAKKALLSIQLEPETMTTELIDGVWFTRIALPKLKASANGKGCSKELSEASAYSELIERLSAGMDTGIDIGPYRQLYGEKGDNLNIVTTYRYMDGYRWTHQDCITDPVTAESMVSKLGFDKSEIEYLKFNSDLLRHWISAYSMNRGKKVYIPILFVKWLSATNGLASGNTMDEAISHAICEIFERYYLIKALKNMDTVEYPTIDIKSVGNDWFKNVVRSLEERNVSIVIKDIGEGIFPVFAIITTNHNIKKGEPYYNAIKAGCSFSHIHALKRCITERFQGTTIEIETSKSIVSKKIDLTDSYLPIFFTGECSIDLSPLLIGPTKEFINNDVIDIEEELLNTKRIVGECLGSEIVVVNHTHPIMNFPVVRVVVPGFSDFMDWWAPNRKRINLIGNIDETEDAYEKELVRVLKTFTNKSGTITDILQDKVRRDK